MRDATFVSIHEAARRLGLSKAFLKSEAESQRIPVLRASGRLMFNVAAVEYELLQRAATSNAEVEEVRDVK